MKMEHLGIESRTAIFSDGQETVNHFERILNSLEHNQLEFESLNVSEHAI